MICYSNFQFSIDGHDFTVIKADGELTEPLMVDQLQILAGQRYFVVLVANQPVDNYWVRSLHRKSAAMGFGGGVNFAILHYRSAQVVDPITTNAPAQNPLVETNLHALKNTGAPGILSRSKCKTKSVSSKKSNLVYRYRVSCK